MDCLNMLQEDFSGRIRQKAELAERRKQLQATMEDYRAKHRDEMKLFFEELEIDDQLAKTQQDKKRLEEKLKVNEGSRLQFMQSIKEKEDTIAKLGGQAETNDRALRAALARGEEELVQVEAELDIQNGPGSFSKAMLDAAREVGIDCERSMFIVQKRLVEAQVAKMLVSEIGNERLYRSRRRRARTSSGRRSRPFRATSSLAPPPPR